MSKPYPGEFREDVIRVARNREPDVRLKSIAQDWSRRGHLDERVLVGVVAHEQAYLGGVNKPGKSWRDPIYWVHGSGPGVVAGRG